MRMSQMDLPLLTEPEKPQEPDEVLLPWIVTPEDPRWDDCLQYWQHSDRFGFDIETYGEGKGDGLNPWRGEIRTVQIGLENGLALLIDLGRGRSNPAPPGFLSLLQERLENRSVAVIGQNLKFDCLFVRVRWGFKARNLRDTMILSQVLWAGAGMRANKPIEGFHKLESIYARLGLGELDKEEQLSDWGAALTNRQRNYAARDALVPLPMEALLSARLAQAVLVNTADIECNAIPAFIEMEFRGFPVDASRLESMIQQYQRVAKEVLEPFEQRFPGIKPNSSAKVASAFNVAFGLALTGTGQTDLAPYWDSHAEIRALSQWRSLMMVLNNCKLIQDALDDSAGVVRGSYQQLAPKGFGRSTCGQNKRSSLKTSNLQNVCGALPETLAQYNLPLVRSAFRPPAGRSLIVVDLSSCHARIAAEASQDDALLAIFRGSGDAPTRHGCCLSQDGGS